MNAPRSNYELIEDVTANVANAAWIEHHIDDWIGPSGASTDPGRGDVADSDPTFAAVLANTQTTRLVDSARAQLDDLALLRDVTNRMNARRNGTLALMTAHQAKLRAHERSTPSTVGYCEADDAYCDASDKYHSIIGGLCGRCRQAWSRWPRSGDPGGDRKQFIASVRAEKAGVDA